MVKFDLYCIIVSAAITDLICQISTYQIKQLTIFTIEA